MTDDAKKPPTESRQGQRSARPSRWRWLWPDVSTLEGAELAIRGAVVAALFCAGATTVLALLGFYGVEPNMGFDLYALVDAGLFALIAFGLWRHSRIAAVVGLLVYVVERMEAFINNPAALQNPVLPIILAMAFLNGVRGTFAWHKSLLAGRSPLPLGTAPSFFHLAPDQMESERHARFCSACGAALSAGSAFCSTCGKAA